VVQRSDELLERFELTEAANRPARTYSGGMRRRLDLAAALVHRPPVLFLDEPTTGLDPSSRSELWAVIAELVQEGTTVLLTTQYLEEADRLADRIAVVDNGRVIAEGTSAELKADLGRTVLSAGFATEDDATRAAEVLAKALGGRPARTGTTIEANAEEGASTLVTALRALDKAKIEPSSIALREPSLDDVFLSLTGHKASADETALAPPAPDTGKGRGRRSARGAA
jgi:ABC-2 type transport system ATP-binding protein